MVILNKKNIYFKVVIIILRLFYSELKKIKKSLKIWFIYLFLSCTRQKCIKHFLRFYFSINLLNGFVDNNSNT